MPDDGQSVLDELVDNSHKHAVGVSKELRTGLVESVEILANEVVQQRRDWAERQHRKLDEYGDARELTLQCLRYLYRLIVLLYAESRPELGILPARDDAYMRATASTGCVSSCSSNSRRPCPRRQPPVRVARHAV